MTEPKFKHYSRTLKEINPSTSTRPISNSRLRYRTQQRLENNDTMTYYPYYTSPLLGSIYQITSPTTDRINVAIISLGGGFLQSDLDNYWNLIGLVERPNVYSVSVNGATNSPGSDADVENNLDIQTIGGILPNSNIYVYFAPNSIKGFRDAIKAAADSTTNPVKVISVSWGISETALSSNQLNTFNKVLQQVANKGITVCVASGDNGSKDNGYSLSVDFPSASPWVLACGGTTLKSPTGVYNTQTTSETGWKGSGGGYSAYFAKPNYQKSVPNLSGITKRAVPDVSANANPNTGCIIAYNNKFYVVGGTSLSAPIWTAYLAGQRFTNFMTPLIYRYGLSGLHDIITGTNGAYKCKIGWDAVTGLGTPSGYVLTRALSR